MSWVFHHVQISHGIRAAIASLFNWRQNPRKQTPTRLHGNLPDGPCGVVAHGDELGVQVQSQDGHELGWKMMMKHPLEICCAAQFI